MKPFSLSQTSLPEETMLLEASAGTGKTYAIEGLYLRLFLEEGINPLEILGVTFTEAATAELRDRIRGRFAGALRNLQQGKAPDPALSDPGKETAGIWQRKLAEAITVFDEVPIFTIHGFCHRMLRDFAFQSGRAFESEVETSPETLIRQLLQDFLRKQFYGGYPLLGVVYSRLSKSMLRWIAKRRSQSHAILFPQRSIQGNWEDWETELAQLTSQIKVCWGQEGEAMRQCFGSGGMFKQKGGWMNEGNCLSLMDELDGYLVNGVFYDQVLTAMLAFAGSDLRESVAKRKHSEVDWDSPLLAACDCLTNWMKATEPAMQQMLADYVDESYPALKRRLNVLTYDDMLSDLHAALHSESGEALARAIRGKYKVALMDEFQDTDFLQWDIFRELFCVLGHRLFLIGDPKQAIYAFRGADVYTYLKAASAAKHRYTLDQNFRSEAKLVAACNQLFSQNSDPFKNKRIAYNQVRDAEKESGMKTLCPGEQLHPAPMQLRCLEDAKSNKDEKVQAVVHSVCREIIQLLNGEVRIGERPVAPSDIAVLVRTKGEGKTVQGALLDCGLNAVLQSDENVFESEEAVMLSTFMAAVLEPGRESKVRNALFMPVFGHSVDAFYEMTRDEESWSGWMGRFAEWNAQWQQHGFLYILRAMLNQTGGQERMLARPGGERTVTNWMHLTEILHYQERIQRLTPEALFSWFEHQRLDPAGTANGEYELRMESDRSAIQVVTIHKSKGLAYGIVFCPFSWTTRIAAVEAPASLHDDNDNAILFNGDKVELEALQFNGENGLERFKREEEGSEIRVLYVALTRARHRCYLYGMKAPQRSYSVLDTMLGRSALDVFPELVNKHPNQFGLEYLTLIGDEPLPQYVPTKDLDAAELQAREFKGEIRREGMLTSFSGLLRGWETEEPERLDPGLVTTGDDESGETDEIFRFPKGIRTGEFFHMILETIDFGGESEWPGIISQACRRHGFSESMWGDASLRIISRVMQAQLPAWDGRGPIQLSELAANCRQAEVEFHLPVTLSERGQLSAIFREILPEQERKEPSAGVKFQFYPVHGYLKGFVDLLFRVGEVYYILDWKTNWLGDHGENYGIKQLAKAMSENGYHLQYHLYTVAIHRFLQQRLPGYDYDRHFGGAYYLFLRGMDPENSSRGIYYRRPDKQSIERIAARLEGKGE